MSKKNLNPYLDSDLRNLIEEQKKNEEFAEAYELERERLRIAHKVKALREKQNMTQAELAGIDWYQAALHSSIGSW